MKRLLFEETVNFVTNRQELCDKTKQALRSKFEEKYPGGCDDFINKKFANTTVLDAFYVDAIKPGTGPIFTGTKEEFYKKYACDKFPQHEYCKTNETPKNEPKTETKCPPDDTYVDFEKDKFTYTEITQKKKEGCKFVKCKDTNKEYYSCPKKEEPKNQGEIGGETDKGTEEVKYPRSATPDEVKRFDSVPCLSQLETKVNLNKEGEETLYKVEISGTRTIFYYEPYQDGSNEGICTIDEGGKKITQYYHCPEKK